MLDTMSLIPVAAFLEQSRVNGPGLRSVLWVQGCPFRCPGCFNPDFQEFHDAELTSIDELTERISAQRQTEGVTFSGGEPFAHAAGLAQLAKRLGDKSLVVFTGYELEELQAMGDGPQQLLAQTDLLIAGRYEEGSRSSAPLLTSANQQVHFLTRRYTPADLASLPNNPVEFHINSAGDTTRTGLRRS